MNDRDRESWLHQYDEPSTIISERDACVGCGADASHSEIDDDRPVRLCDDCYNGAVARARRMAAMHRTKAEALLHIANVEYLSGETTNAKMCIARMKAAG